MPRETDHSDRSSTLPVPDLNPLLNPLLGQNMGRWAEVYFTSPPEKREQAVLELLRELQGENPAHNAASAAPALVGMEHATEPAAPPAPSIAESPQAGIRCRMCGRENPASHRFCGMCGRSLADQPATTGIHVADLHVAEIPVEDPAADRLIEDRLIENCRIEDRSQDRPAPAADAVYEPASHVNELSLFRSGREAAYRDDRSDDIFGDPPATRSYRVSVGIAVAMVIFALGFMTWRNSQTTSRTLHVASQALPAATMPQPAEPAPAAPGMSKSDTPEQLPASPPAADVPRGAASEAASEEAAANRRDKVAKAVPPSTPAPEKNPTAETFAGNGAEELSIAQRYLNGTDGERRNPAEAAKWLWKAMAKHNANATLLLADLYLKGEGVSKNCDQARVLLDSAALRGMKDAGERLRHLQAFGCN